MGFRVRYTDGAAEEHYEFVGDASYHINYAMASLVESIVDDEGNEWGVEVTTTLKQLHFEED